MSGIAFLLSQPRLITTVRLIQEGRYSDLAARAVINVHRLIIFQTLFLRYADFE